MEKVLRFLVLITALLVATSAWAEDHDYDMVVSLDPETHRLDGRQTIRWTNTADVPTNELWWHLYLNGFANSGTTFMRELGGGFLRRGGSVAEMDWGWTRVNAMRLSDGTDLMETFEFQRPDDGNSGDYSVARVILPEEVPPGASVVIETEFSAQLPKIIARTGFAGDFHLVGQWFPKVAVFEGESGWNCHQFHANSEFFADFSTYRVSINVPAGWVVGATGLEISRIEAPEDPSQGLELVYRAERVHDFAWATAPGSLMAVVESEFDPGQHVPQSWLEDAAATLGVSAADLELPPTTLRLLVPRSQLGLSDRLLNAARLGIAWYGLWYGPYPYPQLSIVQPPPSAGEAGGMEYPTFITAGGSRLLTVPPFSWLSRSESVTIHEFGHQYFQGMLASNEFEQAWLDEGLNSYAEASCMEAAYAAGLMPELRWGGFWARERLGFAIFGSTFTIDQQAWQYRSRRQYFQASYGKTALALRTLEGLMGREDFARAMRAYFSQFRYRHPKGDDLFAVFSDVAGEDLGWFFDQAFRSDVSVDWSVLNVRHLSRVPVNGAVWGRDGWSEVERADEDRTDETPVWNIQIELGRTGDFVGPVVAELRYEDGSAERRTWDGADRWVRWLVESDHRLARVIVDPDGVWALETSRRDNYWASTRSSRTACRSMWWISEALHLLGMIHIPWS
jgi:hypothetical protein